MKFGKRQLVLTSLVLALGTAVFLNWQFASTNDLTSPPEQVKLSSKELGQAEFVNSSTDTSVNKNEKDKKEDKATEKSTKETSKEQTKETSKNSSEYFTQCSIERQKTQDKIIDGAKEILESATNDEAVKEQALENATQLAQSMAQQTNIESLIKAKGFSECLAFIQNGECSVVVSKGEMNDESLIVIQDIVEGQTGISFDKIKIAEA